MSIPLLAVNLLAAAVWVGSLAALAVVTRVARETLDPATRVAFFRALGRRYGIVGGLALAIAIGTGGALLAGEPWTAELSVLAGLTVALVLATALGVIQARRVNRLRERHHGQAATEPVAIRASARRAGLLRAMIALLTVAIVVDVAAYLGAP